MNPASKPDEPGGGVSPEAEGTTWCTRCGQESGYRSARVEFLGNPVMVSCFCVECGERTYPGALDLKSARRLRSEGRWLRIGAAGSFALMLLLPLLTAAGILYLLWRLL